MLSSKLTARPHSLLLASGSKATSSLGKFTTPRNACRFQLAPLQRLASRTQPRRSTSGVVVAASSENNESNHEDDKAMRALLALQSMDLNQLQTAMNTAIAAEDYALAAKIRDVMKLVVGTPDRAADWTKLGITDWLAHRAEDLGFRIPTEVQRRAAPVVVDGNDCVVESETGSGKTLAFLLPALSRLDYPPVIYPDDLKGPQLVILVPTRELGVQIVMLTYKLFGGSVNPGIPGERANMYRYEGPRGIKVRGLLLEDEVQHAVRDGYLRGAHVVVGTPDLVAKALQQGVEVVQRCKTIIIDELDACEEQFYSELSDIMVVALQNGRFKDGADEEEKARPSVVLVGATLQEDKVAEAVNSGWLSSNHVQIGVGKRMSVPSGLRHRCIVVDAPSKAGTVARQLRFELKTASQDAAPARVMLFADGEKQARALADPLRTSLWGDHAISVLLPSGAEPIKALHSFRDNTSTLLLATPDAARGLDLPAVSHVYNMSPPGDAAEYIHRAGRAGRIGSPVNGIVTTLVTQEELAALLQIAAELQIEIEQVEPPKAPRVAATDTDLASEGVIDVVIDTEREDIERIGAALDMEEAKKGLEALLAMSDDDDDEGNDRGLDDVSTDDLFIDVDIDDSDSYAAANASSVGDDDEGADSMYSGGGGGGDDDTAYGDGYGDGGEDGGDGGGDGGGE